MLDPRQGDQRRAETKMALNLVRYARPRSHNITAFGWGLSYVGLRTVSSAAPRCSSRRRTRPRTSPKPNSPPTAPKIISTPEPVSLGAAVKRKVQSGSTRKAFEFLESSQGDATAADFRTAVRAFIRAERVDFALNTFRMRENCSHINEADPAVSAAVLRACLRGRKNESYRRDVKRDLAVGTKEALKVLLRDVKALHKEADDGENNTDDPVQPSTAPGPYAGALCQVQIALLKFGDSDSAIEALIADGRDAKRESGGNA